MESGKYILAGEVGEFEKEFSSYCGAGYAVGVASGTEALGLSLLACGIERGDEVITCAHIPVATIAAIEMAGGKPVLVDVDPFRYTMNPHLIAAAVSTRTRFLMPVHLYGCPADLAPILKLAFNCRLVVIEDCAQAHGARYGGQHVGTFGQLGAFSFYPTKNLGAFGDGGAVISNDYSLVERLRRLRQYGWDPDRVSQAKGFNSRLDELQAAILRVKLKHLTTWNARRFELARFYRSHLSDCALGLPPSPPECEPVDHLFVVRCKERDALRTFLLRRGIQTLIHYPIPVHMQPAFANLGYHAGSFPETERLSREVLSLPIFPEMSDEMAGEVSQAVLDFYN
jgi:dTDP-4-amino-4,6-dideoxygalactose transaminase